MNRPAEASAKKPYQAPKLLVYGNLTEITQARSTKPSARDGATMGVKRKTGR
jgi:hypothetical protein